MTDEVKTAPTAEESNQQANTNSEVKTEVKTEVKEETVGEVLVEKKETPKEDSVPLSAFLEIKNSNKEMAKQLKELQKSIEQGASKTEVSSDIKAIADKHGLDEVFLQDFAQSVKAHAEAEIDAKISSRLKPLEEKEHSERINKAFTEHYQKALERMPEYKDVVNQEVIKALSLMPANANKTFTQLLEESYGHLITGKRTLDTTPAKGGKSDGFTVDIDRAKRDSSYFKEVMSDPNLKKQYNDAMMGEVTSMI